MDVSTVVASILSSSVMAAGVAKGFDLWSQHAQEQREYRASRRQVRNAARAFARHIMIARQFGFGTVDGIPNARAALSDLISDRDVLAALSDEQSTALGDAVRDSDALAATVVRANSEESRNETPQNHDHTKMQISGMANGAFIALRRYFDLTGDASTVNEFDKAESDYQYLLRTRYGGNL